MLDVNDIKRRLKEAEAYAPDNPLLRDCRTALEQQEQALKEAAEIIADAIKLEQQLKDERQLKDSAFQGQEVLRERLIKAEAELAEEKKYSESLAADICKMEDVLGFKQDQCDKDGAFVPTLGPWLERVRDLLATEGELGDLKYRLQAVEKKLEQAISLLRSSDEDAVIKFLDAYANKMG